MIDLIDVEGTAEIPVLLPLVDGDAFKAAKDFARRSAAAKQSWSDNYVNHLVALLRSVPVVENAERLRKWRDTHPEEVKAISSKSGSTNLRKWIETHPEEAKISREKASIKGVSVLAEWRNAKPEEAKARAKALGKVNVVHLRKWRELNPEEAKARWAENGARLREWEETHPEEVKAYAIASCKARIAANIKAGPRSASGYKGVYKDQNKWKAALMVNNQMIFVGYFSTPVEAARAYNAAALKYRGPDAYQNPV